MAKIPTEEDGFYSLQGKLGNVIFQRETLIFNSENIENVGQGCCSCFLLRRVLSGGGRDLSPLKKGSSGNVPERGVNLISCSVPSCVCEEIWKVIIRTIS